jgi:hypothetical protein
MLAFAALEGAYLGLEQWRTWTYANRSVSSVPKSLGHGTLAIIRSLDATWRDD